MASGKLAGIDVTTVGAPALLYSPAANKRGVGTVTFCNRTAADIKMRLAVTGGTAPDNGSWDVYDIPVGNIPLKVSGLIVGGGQALYVQAAASGVTVTFNGLEEADV